MTLKLGDAPIDFKLPGVDGNEHSLSDFKDSEWLAVTFSCNHCPYVIGSEKEFVELQEEYGPKGFRIVAINPNDEVNYPQDSFDNMVQRAKEKGFNFPYLRDESQRVAAAYGATRTPEIFLFDKGRKLVFHGRISDNPKAPGEASRHDLKDALEEALTGKPISSPTSQPIGCTIKWKGS